MSDFWQSATEWLGHTALACRELGIDFAGFEIDAEYFAGASQLLQNHVVGKGRRPAKVAGLDTLQRFLERGVAGFASMRGATEFLDTIMSRETALMNAIFAGDDSPFPDPRGTTP